MDIASTIEAGAAVVCVLGSIGVFTFNAGQFKKSIEAGTALMKTAIEDNTKTTERLSNVVEQHMSSTGQTLHEHDIRITKLELKI